MRFDSKKVFKFAGEVSGCVVMGIVSAATQTLWYRIAEPKILNAMDKNEARRKQPIGFRGGSPNGLLFPFRRFCTFLYGEKEFCPISVGSKNCGDFLSFSSADFTNRIMRRRGNPTGCDQATKLFGLDVRLIHGSSFSKKMDRCGWKSRGETRRRTAK